MEISDVVEKEYHKLSLREKIGLGLTYLSLLPVVPYIYNRGIARNVGSTEILPSIANSAGNVPHILVAYLCSSWIEEDLNFRITRIILGLATIYHILGEVFNSEVAPDLPKILPGTPDVKDIPLTIMIGLGLNLYLKNKKSKRKEGYSS